MASKDDWDAFIQSGRIADYLLYRAHLAAETAAESDAAEEFYAHQDRRARDRREGHAGT